MDNASLITPPMVERRVEDESMAEPRVQDPIDDQDLIASTGQD